MSTVSTTHSGQGWAYLEGLADPYPHSEKTDYERPRTDATRAKPNVSVLGKFDGVRVIRLAFREGDVLADHTAAAPILVIGQTGSIDLTVNDPDGVKHMTLAPGTAVHIAPKVVHALSANGPATANLLVLD